jgi:hypothetical protein
MWAYKSGYLTSYENTLIYVNETTTEIETIFHFDYFVHLREIYVAPSGAIAVITEVNSDYHYLNVYCLLKDHPRRLPKDSKCASVQLGDDLFVKFHENLTVFRWLNTFDSRYFFGSALILKRNYYMFFYLMETKSINFGKYLPQAGIKYDNEQNLPSKTSFFKILLTHKKIPIFVEGNMLYFQEGPCIFHIDDKFNVSFNHGGPMCTGKLTCVMKEDSNVFFNLCDNDITFWHNPKNVIQNDIDESLCQGVHSKRFLKCRKPYENEPMFEYVTIDGEFTFKMLVELKYFDYYVVPDGMIVVVGRYVCGGGKYTDEQLELLKDNFIRQGNVLIAIYDYYYGKAIDHENGIILDMEDEYYYLSMETQYVIDLHDCVDIMEFHVFSGSNGTIVKYLVESEDYFYTMPPYFKKLIGIREGKQILEPVSYKKTLLETSEGFYCFDGYESTPFHEETNIALRNLPKHYMEHVDLNMLLIDPMSADAVKYIEKLVYMGRNTEIPRNYAVRKSTYHEAPVNFDQVEKYLPKFIMARLVNNHHSILKPLINGSAGIGPVKLALNAIIDEIVETYFKFDKHFLIPKESFRTANAETKMILGWILHNTLYLLGGPIGYHLPFALLSAILGRGANETELELYAKASDSSLYKRLNTMSDAELSECGYESRLEWLSMMCRYAESDVSLYKDFADGFRSFAETDHLAHTNIVTVDYFISGPNKIGASELIANLEFDEKSDVFGVELSERLELATQRELRNFLFNLTGSYHLTKNKIQIYSEALDHDYKLAVCHRLLVISSKLETSAYTVVINELLQPQQAKILG